MPTHSRTSSSASSVGSSYVSSTDSNKTSNTESPTPIQSNQHQIDATNNFLNSNFHSITANGVSTLPRYHTTYNTIINELNDMNDHEPLITGNLAANESHANEDKTDSLYGRIRTANEPIVNTDNFTYKTLNGDVIRSVHPPGKGNSVNYKVSDNSHSTFRSFRPLIFSVSLSLWYILLLYISFSYTHTHTHYIWPPLWLGLFFTRSHTSILHFIR